MSEPDDVDDFRITEFRQRTGFAEVLFHAPLRWRLHALDEITHLYRRWPISEATVGEFSMKCRKWRRSLFISTELVDVLRRELKDIPAYGNSRDIP